MTAKLLRGLIVIEVIACVILYLSKVLHWEQISNTDFMGLVFLFAYPMIILILVPLLILVVRGIIHFIKNRQISTIAWMAFDVLAVVLSHLIFQAYYDIIT